MGSDFVLLSHQSILSLIVKLLNSLHVCSELEKYISGNRNFGRDILF